MIEKILKSEISKKRWRRFKSNRLAVYSGIIILVLNFFSFTAEFWANSKPIVLQYKNQVYFPIFKQYHPSEFGITSSLIVNYRMLDNQDPGWSVWPLIEWNPFEKNEEVSSYPAPPSTRNLFGTDDRGRDVLTRLLYGLRYGMIYSVSVWGITFVIGVLIGGVMGFFGGKIDFIGQRIIEVLSSTPQFFLLLIIISIFEPSLFWLVLVSCLFGWISISYYARGEFLKNRKREYVEAARALGASKWSQIVKHILPNSLTPVITFSPFVIAANITALASLDYLGFGLEIPTPSWGELLAQAQKHFTIAWWLAVFPSLALFLTLTLLTLVGEGVKDALDPKREQ